MGRSSTDAARLLFPALRWDGERYALEGLDDGDEIVGRVGGFILFGGTAAAARARIASLRGRSGHPLLFGADLERGAGQQLEGCTPLPPAGALGALDDPDVVRRAAELTAREARAVGIDWLFGPVADLDVEPSNPIVGPRAFAGDAEAVARSVVAWLDGCTDGGALGCVKHFPGHGRTTTDSHRELPVVGASRDELRADLHPFRVAVEHGVASVMTAHVAYPALDPSRRPATRSRAIVGELLRGELGFDGVVVTDALIMEGATGAEGAGQAAVEAIAAGVDGLLYPEEARGVLMAVVAAVDDGVLPAGRVEEAVARIETLARAGAVGGVGGGAAAAAGGVDVGRAEDRRWAGAVARRCVRWLPGPGAPPEIGRDRVALRIVDDDVGGPYPPPSRAPLGRALGVREDDRSAASRDDGGGVGTPAAATPVVAVFADTRGWKGRAGLSEDARAAVRRAVGSAADPRRAGRRDAVIVLFGHPRVRADLPPGVPVLCAWGGEALMQRAAAEVLLGREPAVGGTDG